MNSGAFIVTGSQMEILSKQAEEQFIESLRRAAGPGRTRDVDLAIHEARARGLVSAYDLTRYWEFRSSLPEGVWPRWMEDVWQDPWISNPSARLRRILDLLEHRQSVDEQNRQLRVRFEDSQTGPDSAAGALIQASVSGDNR